MIYIYIYIYICMYVCKYVYIYILYVYVYLNEPCLDVAVVISFNVQKAKRENSISYIWHFDPPISWHGCGCSWYHGAPAGVAFYALSTLLGVVKLLLKLRIPQEQVGRIDQHIRGEFPQPAQAVPQGQVFRCFGVHWAAIWHSVNKRREHIELV